MKEETTKEDVHEQKVPKKEKAKIETSATTPLYMGSPMVSMNSGSMFYPYSPYFNNYNNGMVPTPVAGTTSYFATPPATHTPHHLMHGMHQPYANSTPTFSSMTPTAMVNHYPTNTSTTTIPTIQQQQRMHQRQLQQHYAYGEPNQMILSQPQYSPLANSGPTMKKIESQQNETNSQQQQQGAQQQQGQQNIGKEEETESSSQTKFPNNSQSEQTNNGQNNEGYQLAPISTNVGHVMVPQTGTPQHLQNLTVQTDYYNYNTKPNFNPFPNGGASLHPLANPYLYAQPPFGTPRGMAMSHPQEMHPLPPMMPTPTSGTLINRNPTKQATSPKTNKIPAPNGNGGGSHRRKKWTQYYDDLLIEAVKKYNGRHWAQIAQYVGGSFTSDQCNQHWHRVLKPSIRKGEWDDREIKELKKFVSKYGEHSWSRVAEHIPTRTDVQCRCRWKIMKKEQAAAEAAAVSAAKAK